MVLQLQVWALMLLQEAAPRRWLRSGVDVGKQMTWPARTLNRQSFCLLCRRQGRSASCQSIA